MSQDRGLENFTPLLRLPLTDLTSCLVNHQNHGRCPEFEMKMMECYEAYGFERGVEKCKLLIEDYRECFHMSKQNKRIELMKAEREKQYKAGLRSKEGHYAESPPVDSY